MKNKAEWKASIMADLKAGKAMDEIELPETTSYSVVLMVVSPPTPPFIAVFECIALGPDFVNCGPWEMMLEEGELKPDLAWPKTLKVPKAIGAQPCLLMQMDRRRVVWHRRLDQQSLKELTASVLQHVKQVQKPDDGSRSGHRVL